MPKPGQFKTTPKIDGTIIMLNKRITDKMRRYSVHTDATGKIVYSNEDKFDEIATRAVEEIKAEMVALGPDMEDPDKSLQEFWSSLKKRYPNLPEKPKFDGKDEEMRRRMERTIPHRDALLNVMEDNGKKDLFFRQTARKLFPDKGNLKLTSTRYLHRLMQIPASDANDKNREDCRRHNEKVVMLAALLKGDITVDQFKQMRLEQHINDGLDAQAAEKAAGEDVANAPQDFFDLFDSAVKQGKQHDAEVETLTERALSGELTGDHLKQAYQTIFSDSCQLRFVANDFIGDLNELMKYADVHPDKFNKEKNHEYVLQCQDESKMLQTCQNAVCISANPYYAILDPVQMIDAGVMGLDAESVVQINPKDDYSYNSSFVTDLFGIVGQNIFVTEDFLKRYQLENAADTPFPGGCKFHAFANKGRAVICEKEEFSLDHGYKFRMKATDKPGLYASEGFAEKVADLDALGGTLTYGGHGSSRQFDEMISSLGALRDVTLDDNAPEEQLANMQQKLETVRQKTERYFARKQPKRDRRGGRGKNKYEEDRWNFAKNLDRFAEEKLKQLKTVQMHKATVSAVEQEEIERAQRENEQQAAAGPNPNIINEAAEPERIDQNEVKNEIKDEVKGENPNVINEVKKKPGPKFEPLASREADWLSGEMTTLIKDACRRTAREDWAHGQRIAGPDSKANKYLDERIEFDTTYALKNANAKDSMTEYSMKSALINSVMKYMMNQEKSKGILEFAFEHGQSVDLFSNIEVMPSFKEQIKKLDMGNEEQRKQYLQDETLFIKPMGDIILNGMEGVLAKFEPMVEQQRTKNAVRMAENAVDKQVKESEKALSGGDVKNAKEFGTDSLAWQTVSGLLKQTAGKAGDLFELRKMLNTSSKFQEELEKIDFSKTGAVKEALEAKFGSKVAGMLVNLARTKQQDGNPPRDKENKIVQKNNKQMAAQKQNGLN